MEIKSESKDKGIIGLGSISGIGSKDSKDDKYSRGESSTEVGTGDGWLEDGITLMVRTDARPYMGSWF